MRFGNFGRVANACRCHIEGAGELFQGEFIPSTKHAIIEVTKASSKWVRTSKIRKSKS
jgi:hypothetical protein